MDFVVGELSVQTGVCTGVREPPTVVIAAAGLGIELCGPPNDCFAETKAMKVCAVTIPADAKRRAVPTRGYRRWPPRHEFAFDRSRRVCLPARRAIGRGYAAVW